MTPQTFEAAILAQTSFRLAQSNSVDEMVAIACVIRGHVVPKPGQFATYKSYPEACKDFLQAYPVRSEPDVTEDVLISQNGLLSLIEKIYSCEYLDITATQTTPGARLFARTANLSETDWRWSLIKSGQLLGSFGSQQFYHY